jgi:hypothetical protein
MRRVIALSLFCLGPTLGCGGDDEATTPVCTLGDGADPDFSREIGCRDDFLALASEPLDSSIPGARSVKTVIDRVDDDALYFQNSERYAIHWEFVSEHLSGDPHPIVPMLSSFNTTEYYSPSRRFMLGAVTYYAGADRYCYEIAPYDAADEEMIAKAYSSIADHSFIGKNLYFHPTSEAVERVADDLPSSVRIMTTDELFEGVDYQALNQAESYGRIRFISEAELLTEYVSFRDIVVLDTVPNDISVTMGIITSDFQTPLAHINVLSQNRGTPNMALRDAFENEELRALDGKWVRLKVGGSDYEIEEVDRDEADLWWDEQKPAEVQVPGMNLEVTDLRDIAATIDLEAEELFDAVKTGTRAFGGKAAHFGGLAHVEDLPIPQAFAIPVYYYSQFMEQNGFDLRVAELLEDPDFQDSAEVRDAELEALRDDMKVAPVDADFEALLRAKLEEDFPGVRMRFRSSTNAEDLDGFTGAGLYTSKSGEKPGVGGRRESEVRPGVIPRPRRPR